MKTKAPLPGKIKIILPGIVVLLCSIISCKGPQTVIAEAFRGIDITRPMVNLADSSKTASEMNKTYLEFKDGSRVYGQQFTYTTGLAGGRISIDNQSFKTKDVRWLVNDGLHYHPVEHYYALRIITGNLNVYWLSASFAGSTLVPNSSGYGYHKENYSYGGAGYYLQKGDDGKLIPWTSLSQLRLAIDDCPEAIKMLNHFQDKKSRETVEADYLVEIVKAYNTCKK